MLLETRDVRKSFSGKPVLQGVDLRAESGRALGFLGRNGAGKTTTLRIIMGVFAAESGQVLLDGAPLDRRRVTIGYMPEERGLYPKHTIEEQLLYLGQLKGVSRKVARKHMGDLLEQLELAGTEKKRLDTLSKGNQQKIQLVATLISDPEIIVLDEPFSGLDPVNAVLLKKLVRSLIDRGRVVLFSSHQMHYVEEFCDDIAILHGGRVVLSGDLSQIQSSGEQSRLWVRGRDLPKVASYALETLSGSVQEAAQREGALLLTLREAAQKRPVMQALLAQDFDVDGLEVYKPSLSDLFVRYTGEGV